MTSQLEITFSLLNFATAFLTWALLKVLNLNSSLNIYIMAQGYSDSVHLGGRRGAERLQGSISMSVIGIKMIPDVLSEIPDILFPSPLRSSNLA